MLSKVTAFLDANKGKMAIAATFVVGGLSALGVEVPSWVIAILATQGISTTVRLHAGNGA